MTRNRHKLVAIEVAGRDGSKRIVSVLKPREASIYVRSFNQLTHATGFSARKRPVVWSLADERKGGAR
jgi:hypothetical protein